MLDDISINDEYDGNIISNLTYFPTQIDTSQVGKHYIYYYVSDNHGNFDNLIRIVEVADSFQINYREMLPYLIILIALSAITIFIIERKIKRNI